MWMGSVGVFFPICLPDEGQEEKLAHDQRCPEVMPSLESWSFLFSTGPFSLRNSSQESELLPVLSHRL